MKRIILCASAFIFLIFPHSQAQEAKPIFVTKNNQVFLKFSNSVNISEKLKEQDIQMKLLWVQDTTLRVFKNTILFHISDFQSQEAWILEVTQNGKTKKIPIIIRVEKEKENFDISQDVLLKRLQDKALSCESSIAADIASHLLEKTVSEDDIIDILPKSFFNTKATEIMWKKIWGNPNAGFVWYIGTFWDTNEKPTQKKMTGYGVYEAPIAKTLEKLGLKTRIINQKSHTHTFWPKEHLTALLTELEKWSMVELWADRCTVARYEDGTLAKTNITEALAQTGTSGKNECYDVDSERILEWHYYDDTTDMYTLHQGLAGEHTFMLLWWKWASDNPTHIIVWDSDTGKHTYPYSEWMRKWKKMGYKSLIVSK